MQNRPALGLWNWVDSASSLTATTAATGLPVDYLKVQGYEFPWRSTDTLVQTIDVDFGVSKPIDVVALFGCNFNTAALWQVQVSDTSGHTSPLYDSTQVSTWPGLQTYIDALPFPVASWDDVFDENHMVRNALAILPNQVSGRYLRVRLWNSSNPAGYVQAARLWAGPVFQPEYGPAFDWQVRVEDPTVQRRSPGGHMSINSRANYRVLNMAFPWLSPAEAYVIFGDYLDNRRGKAKDLVFLPQPLEADLLVHETIYGRLVNPDSINNPFLGTRSRSIQVEEFT